MVERNLAKVEVAGSSPVIRLKRVSEKVLAFCFIRKTGLQQFILLFYNSRFVDRMFTKQRNICVKMSVVNYENVRILI